MATTSMTNQDSPGPISALSCGMGGALTTAADASPRWSDSNPRPGSDHRASTTPPPDGRPPLAFLTGCHQYQAVCGFYVCVHGSVRRITTRVEPGSRR